MRVVHTSDWHLGHRLYDVPREREHARFLSWLLDLLVAESADALVVAGDVFDSANPPAEALQQYFGFLAACLRRLPQLDVVILGGNHDSPARLDAPAEVLRALRVHVLGGLQRAGGVLQPERALVPLHDARSEVAAWLVAVPYLRPGDLPILPAILPATLPALPAELSAAPPDNGQPVATPAGVALLAGIRATYEQLFAAARAQRRPGQALLAAGHCLLGANVQLSVDSERKIQLGNQLPLPAELFPPDVAYVALGHLHRAQRVGELEHIRYCGSPIPLALSEKTYLHQVLVVDLDGAALKQVRPVPVPRSVPMLSVPPEARPLSEVLPLLRDWPRQPPAPDAERPYLEVRVQLLPGESGTHLRGAVEEALDGAWARLLRIHTERAAAPAPLPVDAAPPRLLRELDPEEIFERCYKSSLGVPEVPDEQRQLFRSLLEEVQSEAAARGGAL